MANEAAAARDLSGIVAEALARRYERVRQRVHGLLEPLSTEQLWHRPFPFGNSLGHLLLHLTGNLRYYIGAQIAGTGYVRDRPKEFTDATGRARDEVLAAFDEAVALAIATVRAQSPTDWAAAYQAVGEEGVASRFEMLLGCAAHADHHLGQMIYIRMQLDRDAGAARETRPDAAMVTITTASTDDAATILALQKLAYQSEARLNNDWSLPPLTQTLESLLEEFGHSIVLKAMLGDRLVGSVRARQEGDTCLIGRLIVHPDVQGQGIGSRLLHEIEARFADAARFELFTGSKSERNIRLYQRHGYVISRTQALSPAVTITYLDKRNQPQC